MLERRELLATKITVVDLLVGYTTAAKTRAGGQAQIEGQITRLVADLNQTLTNSRIHESVHLVKMLEVSYTSTGSSSSDLTNLNSGAALASLRTARDTYKADLVSLVTDARYGGTAGQPLSTGASDINGYSVASSIAFPTTFLHEVGHTLGAGHDRSNTQQQTSGYAYARDYIATVGTGKPGTTMAGWGIPFFSNPNVHFRGVAVGVADTSASSADNARAMNLLAPTIAGWRAGTANTVAPVAGLGPVQHVNGTTAIHFKVVYYDAGGVDVTSLDSKDVVVTGPGLAAAGAHATFNGLSTKAAGDPTAILAVTATTMNESVIIADYTVHVTAGTKITDLSSYTFKLQAGQVKDQQGNVAAGGTLLSASGDPLSKTAPVILPGFAGPSSDGNSLIGRAAELGNLTSRQLRIDDFVGKALGQRDNAYRFHTSAQTKLSFNTSGLGVTVEVYHDTTDRLSLWIPDPTDSRFMIQRDPLVAVNGVYTLAKGNNYYIVVTPKDSTTSGLFSLKATGA